jgi:ketosteroid isomerase-like protein
VHPEAGIYQSDRLPWGDENPGHEGFAQFLTKLTSTVESGVETGLFVDAEDGRVVQVGRARGKVRATGREFDVPETHVWTVEGGKAIRYEAYIDTAKMREARGLWPDGHDWSPEATVNPEDTGRTRFGARPVLPAKIHLTPGR